MAMGHLLLASATMRGKALSAMLIGPPDVRNYRPVYADAEQTSVDHYTCDYDSAMMKSKGRFPPPTTFHTSLSYVTATYLSVYRPFQTREAPHLRTSGPLLLQANLKPISSEWLRRVYKKVVVPQLDNGHSDMSPHGVRHSQTMYNASNSTTSEQNAAWGQGHDFKTSQLYYNLNDASDIAEAANTRSLNDLFAKAQSPVQREKRSTIGRCPTVPSLLAAPPPDRSPQAPPPSSTLYGT